MRKCPTFWSLYSLKDLKYLASRGPVHQPRVYGAFTVFCESVLKIVDSWSTKRLPSGHYYHIMLVFLLSNTVEGTNSFSQCKDQDFKQLNHICLVERHSLPCYADRFSRALLPFSSSLWYPILLASDCQHDYFYSRTGLKFSHGTLNVWVRICFYDGLRLFRGIP